MTLKFALVSSQTDAVGHGSIVDLGMSTTQMEVPGTSSTSKITSKKKYLHPANMGILYDRPGENVGDILLGNERRSNTGGVRR